MTIHIAYDDRLLRWRLGKNHPTNPERAKNAIHMLEQLGADVEVHGISDASPLAMRMRLEQVHAPGYVQATLEGLNDEWKGKRPDLGATAALMFQGTVDMVERLQVRGPGVYFSPQGAKHHAMYASGSGFCTFNDAAWACQYLARQGERVLYVDFDAHAGDGVENLTFGNTDVMTCSIHDGTIFPGTGHHDHPDVNVFNWPLPAESGDAELIASIEHALGLAEQFNPTVLFVAVGGDGHANDPLSSLQYSFNGYAQAAHLIGAFAYKRRAPVLIGGAGGYLPHDVTPMCWTTFVAGVDAELETRVYV